MPGSILINDGRRSASPDRRVTFGNIERYDIMTSNEIRNNINQRRDAGAPSTVNGNYPMTRLDNRIRKSLLLGFSPMPGDSVTYDEIIDFLIEFNVIAHQRVCSERQITAIVQASFPRVVTKPSAKYNLIFVNLENNSDDVIKEELVRVTTEPIIDPASREAQVWIEEVDEENLVERSEYREEDEELTAIENKKLRNDAVNQRNVQALQQQQQQQQLQQPIKSPPPADHQYNQNGESTSVPTTIQQTENGNFTDVERTPTGSPRDDATDSSSALYLERGVDVKFERSPRAFKESLNNNRSLSKSTGELRNDGGVSLRRNTSFSKKNMDRDRSISVIDVTKKFENNNNTDESPTNEEGAKATITKSVSTTNLQRKRSFTKSTNPSFVGSIREKFRSSLRKNKSSSGGDGGSEKDKDKENNAKVSKKDEQSEKKSASIVVKRGASTKASFSTKSNTDNKQGSTKIGPNNDIRLSVNKSVNKSTNGRFGGSSVDIRNSTKVKTNESSAAPVNKSLSNSASDIRSASVRVNSSRELNKDQEVRASFRSSSVRQSVNRNASDYSSNTVTTNTNNNNNNDQEKSNFVRATSSKSNDPRSSVRRNTSSATEVRSSVRKTNDNRPTVTKLTSSVRLTSSNSTVNSSTRNQTARTLTPRENNTAKRTGAGLRRSNSRAGTSNNKGNSNTSSAASTPNISRENSRSNMKIPIRRNQQQQQQTTDGPSSPYKQSPRKTANKEPQTPEEKDILRIAKAFQKATNEIDAARDNVEQFMINIVCEDVLSCPNNRLHIDELYDHIRHRMIVSQNLIFDGYRSEIRVDMSQYFELFFTALASHMNRVGCEIITDPATQQKACYLTHVKLVEYANGVQSTIASDEQQLESDDDDMQASYV